MRTCLPSAGALSWLLGEPALARKALRLTGASHCISLGEAKPLRRTRAEACWALTCVAFPCHCRPLPWHVSSFCVLTCTRVSFPSLVPELDAAGRHAGSLWPDSSPGQEPWSGPPGSMNEPHACPLLTGLSRPVRFLGGEKVSWSSIDACLGRPVLGLEVRRVAFVSTELPGPLPPRRITVALELTLSARCSKIQAGLWVPSSQVPRRAGGWPLGMGLLEGRGSGHQLKLLPGLRLHQKELEAHGPRPGSQGHGQDHTGEDWSFSRGSDPSPPTRKGIFI